MKLVFPAYSLEKGTSKSSKPFSPILKKKYRAVINKKPLLFSLATINWRFQYDSRLYLTYKEALKQIIIFFKIHHLSPLSLINGDHLGHKVMHSMLHLKPISKTI